MNINDAYPSDFLKASDLQGRTVNVTISHVAMETLGNEQKPVLYFQGKDKGLALNKTNGNSIANMYGPETDHWAGKGIAIFPTETDYQGKRVPCIRVTKPGGVQQTPPTQAPSFPTENPAPQNGYSQDFDDEIPF